MPFENFERDYKFIATARIINLAGLDVVEWPGKLDEILKDIRQTIYLALLNKKAGNLTAVPLEVKSEEVKPTITVEPAPQILVEKKI